MDVDSVQDQLRPQRVGQPPDRMLCRRVRRVSGKGHVRERRGDEDELRGRAWRGEGRGGGRRSLGGHEGRGGFGGEAGGPVIGRHRRGEDGVRLLKEEAGG
jgi:hypothetical protein